MTAFGAGLALVVGIVLGLLGGGGSILAVPIFLYAFPIFRGLAFILIAIWCWGVCVYAFQHYK